MVKEEEGAVARARGGRLLENNGMAESETVAESSLGQAICFIEGGSWGVEDDGQHELGLQGADVPGGIALLGGNGGSDREGGPILKSK